MVNREIGMRRVLIVNYHYPPIGGAGALRGVKLVSGLPKLGYEPIVVTGPGGAHGRWRPEDSALAAELDDVEVHRIPGEEPKRRTGLKPRAEGWLPLREPWERWLSRGLR